jgi:hypothetical protein
METQESIVLTEPIVGQITTNRYKKYLVGTMSLVVSKRGTGWSNLPGP